MTRARDNANLDGLDLITSATIGNAVSSITVNNCFSSAYDNYKIVMSGGTCSKSPGTDINMQLGSTTTGYGHMLFYYVWSNGSSGYVSGGNASSFPYFFVSSTNGHIANVDVLSPYLEKNTFVSPFGASFSTGRWGGGCLQNTTSYTSFTLTPAAGTLTGGTIQVYGYRK